MQHMKSKETLDFAANAWLSWIQPDEDTVWAFCIKRRTSYFCMCIINLQKHILHIQIVLHLLKFTSDLFSYRILFSISKRIVLILRSDFFSITPWVTHSSGIKYNLKKVFIVQLQSQRLRLWERKNVMLVLPLALTGASRLPHVITSFMV